MEQESFWTLCQSLSHWEFEIFLMVLFDGLIGGLLWGLFLGPWVRKKLRHHESDDDKIARLEKQVRRLRRQMRRIKTEEKDHAAS